MRAQHWIDELYDAVAVALRYGATVEEFRAEAAEAWQREQWDRMERDKAAWEPKR